MTCPHGIVEVPACPGKIPDMNCRCLHPRPGSQEGCLRLMKMVFLTSQRKRNMPNLMRAGECIWG